MSAIQKKNLNEVVNRAIGYLKTSPSMNESNTKSKVILPLIKALGWDVYDDKEVILEYPVRVGTSTAKVDYALMINGIPRILVEAKGYDSEIGPNHAQQAISYGRIEGVKWCVLTNGKSLSIYNSTLGKDPKACFVLKLAVQEYMDSLNNIQLISKDAIVSGKSDKINDTIIKNREAIDNIHNNKQKIIGEIKQVLSDNIDNIEKYNVDVKIENLINELTIIMSDSKRIEKKSMSVLTKQTESVRKDLLDKYEDGDVAIYPAKPSGAEFFWKYSAWGFVRVNENRIPKYVALYVGAPFSAIVCIGEVKEISPPANNVQDIINMGIEEKDVNRFTPGKRVIFLKQNTLLEFSDPIPWSASSSSFRSVRHSTISKLARARTTEDI